MKQYNITPDNIRDYMINYEGFPLEIDDKAGLDFEDNETKARLHNSCIYQKKSKTRCVKLEITSFRGISWGAIHYYGKLIADGIDFQYRDDPKTTTSNWEAKKKNPFYQWRYEFDLMRPVTQEEIDSDPDRWYGYDPEGFTSSFDTKEEIIALAKECFKMRFKGEWELWVEDNTVVKDCVYQISFEDEPKFKVGYTVRNKISGSVGEIIALPYSEDFDWLTVQIVTRSGMFAKRKWSVANLELVTKH
ncbi:MAG: hypothetical protein K2M69_05795 [Muribaculaceae bacterium]|nr:hypothetical protein [Muribaculaceae bacterium]